VVSRADSKGRVLQLVLVWRVWQSAAGIVLVMELDCFTRPFRQLWTLIQFIEHIATGRRCDHAGSPGLSAC
jgi:hypothetical protein